MTKITVFVVDALKISDSQVFLIITNEDVQKEMKRHYCNPPEINDKTNKVAVVLLANKSNK